MLLAPAAAADSLRCSSHRASSAAMQLRERCGEPPYRDAECARSHLAGAVPDAADGGYEVPGPAPYLRILRLPNTRLAVAGNQGSEAPTAPLCDPT